MRCFAFLEVVVALRSPWPYRLHYLRVDAARKTHIINTVYIIQRIQQIKRCSQQHSCCSHNTVYIIQNSTNSTLLATAQLLLTSTSSNEFNRFNTARNSTAVAHHIIQQST